MNTVTTPRNSEPYLAVSGHSSRPIGTIRLRRSNLDKRKAVETLLNDPEWSQWSDREIARRCAVGHPLVSSIRAIITGSSSSDNEPHIVKYEDRWGNAREMRTGNIGRSKLDMPLIQRTRATTTATSFDDDDGPALPPSVPWDERDGRTATTVLACSAVVAQHDARRVAYAGLRPHRYIL